MYALNLKTEDDIKKMAEGGAILAEAKKVLYKAIEVGVSAWDIETLADSFIRKAGAEPSFKKVPGYKWATCVNINSGAVHGIPKKETIFKKEDVISVDVGVYYRGFHTDSACSKYLGTDPGKKKFLEVGRKSLDAAIASAIAGNTIGDISKAYETVLKGGGYNPIWSLTGHGVGRELHEDPYIPCFYKKTRESRVTIVPGMTLALEVMYTTGSGDIVLDKDGWTLRTRDGTIAALFEETVAITQEGTIVLT